MGFKRIPNVRSVIRDLIAKYSQSNLQDIAEDAEVVEISDVVTNKEKELKDKIAEYGNS